MRKNFIVHSGNFSCNLYAADHDDAVRTALRSARARPNTRLGATTECVVYDQYTAQKQESRFYVTETRRPVGIEKVI